MNKKSHARAAGKTGFSVALPTALTGQIEHIAAAQHRSRNGQIEHFLTDAVARWQREHPPSLAPYTQPEAYLRRDLVAESDAAPMFQSSDRASNGPRARVAKPMPPDPAPKQPRFGAERASSAIPPAASSVSLTAANSKGKAGMEKEKKGTIGYGAYKPVSRKGL
jgi:hypothetical protein